jgi:hypothetical protein
MKTSRLLAALSLTALALGAVPAAAEGEPLPAACGGKAPALAEGETLVEHTMFLHGTNQVGDYDGAEDLLGSRPQGTFMNDTAPTSPVSKVDNNMGSGGNAAFNGNPLLSYWALELDAPARIVCAAATLHSTDNGNPSLQLFVDQPYATAQVAATGTTTGTGAGVRTHNGTFKPFDVEAELDLTFQVIGSRSGVQMLYDSTTHPSTFTYVTVEAAPPPADVIPAP